MQSGWSSVSMVVVVLPGSIEHPEGVWDNPALCQLCTCSMIGRPSTARVANFQGACFANLRWPGETGPKSKALRGIGRENGCRTKTHVRHIT